MSANPFAAEIWCSVADNAWCCGALECSRGATGEAAFRNETQQVRWLSLYSMCLSLQTS